ncbi:MAG: cell division ATP-binding protein FtsE [Bacteriovoracia bacterium]
MLTLKGVSKSYQESAKTLDGVDLHLQRGEFLYVVGGTGAGKSSLLRLMATEEAPTQGQVSVMGYDLGRITPSTLRSLRQAVGYIPQNVRLIPDLSVYENVALAMRFAHKKYAGAESRDRVEDYLRMMGLSAKRAKPAGTLSGGEAQRVAAARAFVRQPDLIIADEPTGAQDRDFTWALMDLLIKANKQGATVVVATHDREIVRRVRKKCAILNGGRLTLEEHHVCTY